MTEERPEALPSGVPTMTKMAIVLIGWAPMEIWLAVHDAEESAEGYQVILSRLETARQYLSDGLGYLAGIKHEWALEAHFVVSKALQRLPDHELIEMLREQKGASPEEWLPKTRALLADFDSTHGEALRDMELRLKSLGHFLANSKSAGEASQDQEPRPRSPGHSLPSSESEKETLDLDNKPLSKSAQTVLLALHREGVADADSRISSEKIADVVQDMTGRDGVSGESLKYGLRQLRDVQLVLVQMGRNGGYWLTQEGQARAEKINPKQSE